MSLLKEILTAVPPSLEKRGQTTGQPPKNRSLASQIFGPPPDALTPGAQSGHQPRTPQGRGWFDQIIGPLPEDPTTATPKPARPLPTIPTPDPKLIIDAGTKVGNAAKKVTTTLLGGASSLVGAWIQYPEQRRLAEQPPPPPIDPPPKPKPSEPDQTLIDQGQAEYDQIISEPIGPQFNELEIAKLRAQIAKQPEWKRPTLARQQLLALKAKDAAVEARIEESEQAARVRKYLQQYPFSSADWNGESLQEILDKIDADHRQHVAKTRLGHVWNHTKRLAKRTATRVKAGVITTATTTTNAEGKTVITIHKDLWDDQVIFDGENLHTRNIDRTPDREQIPLANIWDTLEMNVEGPTFLQGIEKVRSIFGEKRMIGQNRSLGGLGRLIIRPSRREISTKPQNVYCDVALFGAYQFHAVLRELINTCLITIKPLPATNVYEGVTLRDLVHAPEDDPAVLNRMLIRAINQLNTSLTSQATGSRTPDQESAYSDPNRPATKAEVDELKDDVQGIRDLLMLGFGALLKRLSEQNPQIPPPITGEYE